uniref:Thioredoxin, mitochondrial n=1 Tax=Leptobrachium leishanense TaxID=445787 RepID=A0A8C5QSL3_9ANUR
MAQRIFLNRSLARSLQGFKIRHQPFTAFNIKNARTVSRPSLQSSILPSIARHFSQSPQCRVTFNVQDAEDFKERVVDSETPVLVDFHAQWCGPCTILAPRLEKVVAKQQGKVVMAKVDIDNNTDLAIEYQVSAVPTVLAMKKGNVVDRFVGLQDEDQLEVFVKKMMCP